MNTRIIMLGGCLLMALSCLAQKKEISQARTYVKSGKDLDKAERLMTGLLKQEKNRSNARIYYLWYQAVEGQYQAVNVKLYLRQKSDTAQFFNLVRRMFLVAEALDSVDARPDKKGRARPEYRRRHAEQLNALRPNIYYGGSYQMRLGNYDEAYAFFDTYINTASQPLFADYNYAVSDTLMPQAAYWATASAFLGHRPDSVLRYSQLALSDLSRRDYTLQYVAEAYRWKSDEAQYVETLRKGFSEYPEHPYFFPRLADMLTAKGRQEEVLALADRGLAVNSRNELFLLARSMALLQLGRSEECVETSKQLIVANETMPEPYFNIATVLLNEALLLEEENEPRKNRARLQKLYSEACPYMENFRRLAPDEQDKWAPALYRIYLNLNMGKQFDEIDRLLRQSR